MCNKLVLESLLIHFQRPENVAKVKCTVLKYCKSYLNVKTQLKEIHKASRQSMRKLHIRLQKYLEETV